MEPARPRLLSAAEIDGKTLEKPWRIGGFYGNPPFDDRVDIDFGWLCQISNYNDYNATSWWG